MTKMKHTAKEFAGTLPFFDDQDYIQLTGACQRQYPLISKVVGE